MDLVHGQFKSTFSFSLCLSQQLAIGANLFLTVTALLLASTVNRRRYSHQTDPFKLHATKSALLLLIYGLFSFNVLLCLLKSALLPPDRDLDHSRVNLVS